MDCTFRTIGADVHRCTACGFMLSTPHPPARIHRRCPAGGEPPVARAETPLELERRAICRPCPDFCGEICGLLYRTVPSPLAAWKLYCDCLAGVDGDCLGCPRGFF